MGKSLEVLSFEPQKGHVLGTPITRVWVGMGCNIDNSTGVVEVDLQDGIIHRRGLPQQDGDP
jgi:hypothetical protein